MIFLSTELVNNTHHTSMFSHHSSTYASNGGAKKPLTLHHFASQSRRPSFIYGETSPDADRATRANGHTHTHAGMLYMFVCSTHSPAPVHVHDGLWWSTLRTVISPAIIPGANGLPKDTFVSLPPNTHTQTSLRHTLTRVRENPTHTHTHVNSGPKCVFADEVFAFLDFPSVSRA